VGALNRSVKCEILKSETMRFFSHFTLPTSNFFIAHPTCFGRLSTGYRRVPLANNHDLAFFYIFKFEFMQAGFPVVF
jgi:hypothetical protein